MKTSEAGRNLIKSLEGLRLTAYPDGTRNGVQLYSIGYGHNGVPQNAVITREQADALLENDLARFEAAVARGAGANPPTQGQFDALVSLAFNIGEGAFAQSTLLQRHNEARYLEAADQFAVWRLSNGAINPTLVKRRERERAVYLQSSPTTDNGFPTFPPAPSSAPPPLPESVIGALPVAIFFCPSCGERCGARLTVGVELDVSGAAS